MNVPTIIVAVIVALIFIAIVFNEIRNKKNGKGSCNCGSSCGGCAMRNQCHGGEQNK